MTVPQLVRVVDRQQWLDAVAESVRPVVQGAFGAAGPAGRVVANGLYGVWLKHPLHPVLTDMPIGAWTVALVLDALDASGACDRSDRAHSAALQKLTSIAERAGYTRQVEPSAFARGADTAVAVGVLGALGAALSGVADWQHEYERTARLGLAHGLLNASATTLYATSLLMRAAGKRRTGRGVALAGFGLLLAASYLGGDLVFRERLGIDRTNGLEPPEDFTAVLDDAELAEGTMQRVRVKGVPVLLARQEGTIYALVNTCSHRGGPLHEGELQDGCVVCPGTPRASP